MKKVVGLLVLVLGVYFISGCSVKKTAELTDAEKFANEYSISDEHPFTYATIDEVLDVLKNKTGIIFFGDSDCEWCTTSVSVFRDIAVDEGIEKIYYYNPKNIQMKNTKKYQELSSLLEIKEKQEFSIPSIYGVVDGKITFHSSTTTGEVTEGTKEKLRKQYSFLIKQYRNEECTKKC